ncbi:MAG TPA: aminotransferase class I/II-fold pyridoxal phosphate-dependent enzyme, partial [Caulobacteraceae bacterium]
LALRGDFLTGGPLVERFERAFADYVGAPEAVVCSNGTTALHLAVKAAELQAGDAAIVPAITFVATANAVRFEGGEVIFADVDPDTGLMTPGTLDEAFRRAGDARVRLVMPVHLAGAVVDMPAVRALAEARGAAVVEDACHALGTEVAGVQVGACPDSLAACFSLHPVKTLTSGEGGMVTTRDPGLAARMRRLRGHGVERDPGAFLLDDQAFEDGHANPWWHEMQDLGFNYRLPDVLCALGLSQLSRLDRFVSRRRRLEALYREALAPLAPLVRIAPPVRGVEPCLHLLQVRIDLASAGISRRVVMERLQARGVGTQVHYIPVNRQPYYRALGAQPLPGADAFYAGTLSLPLFPDMDDADPARVCAALAEALEAV